MRALVIAFAVCAQPAIAQQAITFPISVPQECVQLALREHVPVMIENRYQATIARIKLTRLNGADPMVAECKQAVARLKA